MAAVAPLVVASNNPHKLAEFAAALQPLGYAVRAPQGGFAVEETGDSFAANAQLKVAALILRPGDCALADDSGLQVAALGGAPGIFSARYADRPGGPAVPGDATRDARNRQKLLTALSPYQDVAARRARFVCALAWRDGSTGRTQTVEGTVSGHIALSEAGDAGFGYDRLFVPDGAAQTFAQLGAAHKAAHSHRAAALRALLAVLPPVAPSRLAP